jgi:hypothetical protein
MPKQNQVLFEKIKGKWQSVVLCYEDHDYYLKYEREGEAGSEEFSPKNKMTKVSRTF